MSRPALICLLVVFRAAVASRPLELTLDALMIGGTTVTLKCPENEGVKWEKDGILLKPNGSELVIHQYSDQSNGLYKCTTGQHSSYFYTKLNVCEGCVELDMMLATGVIAGDMLMTLGVILIVYLCAQGKAAPAASPQRAQRRQPSAAPPSSLPTASPIDPAYQTLNPGTRSADIYSDVKQK